MNFTIWWGLGKKWLFFFRYWPFAGIIFKTDYLLGVYQYSRYFWGIVRIGSSTLLN